MRYQTLFIYEKEIRVTNGIISSIVTEAKGKDIVEKAQVFEEGRQRHAREAGFSLSDGQFERSVAGVYGRGTGGIAAGSDARFFPGDVGGLNAVGPGSFAINHLTSAASASA